MPAPKTDCRVTGEAAEDPLLRSADEDEPEFVLLFAAAEDLTADDDLVAEPAAFDAPEAAAEEVTDLAALDRSIIVVLVISIEFTTSDEPVRAFLY